MDSSREFTSSARNTESAGFPEAESLAPTFKNVVQPAEHSSFTERTSVTTQAPVSRPSAAQRSSEDALLADAGRIFEQLRIRLAELDHREQSLQEQSQELDERQSRFTRWVEQTKEDLTSRESRLHAQETALKQQQTELNHLGQQTEQNRLQLEREQQHFSERLANQEAQFLKIERDLEELRRTRLDELERLEQESAEKLASRRREFEQHCQTQLEEIGQQQAQATRRLKLQEDHLERLRTQVEQQRTALQLQTQASRQKLQKRNEILRLRDNQLRHARTLLDQRAETFRREERVAREATEQEKQTLKARLGELQKRQEEWEELYSSQKQDLTVTRNTLDRQEQQVLLQREKMLQLRQEIQQQHAENLEIRLAIEELKIELALERGKTPDLDSLNAIRDKLAEHFVSTRNQLEELEKRLSLENQELQQRVTQHRQYEEETRRWVGEGLAAWAEQRQLLENDRSQFENQRAEWENGCYALISERREAEKIIQSLLDQLEQAAPAIERQTAEAA